MSQPSYPGRRVPPVEAISILDDAKNQPGYRFIPSDISLNDTTIFNSQYIVGPSQVTDVYLVGLCLYHKLKFATFDRSIQTAALINTPADLITWI